ncbi:MAG: hypothetical protein ACOYJ2_02355 [Rickettsiales bacterium]
MSIGEERLRIQFEMINGVDQRTLTDSAGNQITRVAWAPMATVTMADRRTRNLPMADVERIFGWNMVEKFTFSNSRDASMRIPTGAIEEIMNLPTQDVNLVTRRSDSGGSGTTIVTADRGYFDHSFNDHLNVIATQGRELLIRPTGIFEKVTLFNFGGSVEVNTILSRRSSATDSVSLSSNNVTVERVDKDAIEVRDCPPGTDPKAPLATLEVSCPIRTPTPSATRR